MNKSKHEPQSAVCYEYLVSKMQRGELVPGMSVTEQGVADELGSVALLLERRSAVLKLMG